MGLLANRQLSSLCAVNDLCAVILVLDKCNGKRLFPLSGKFFGEGALSLLDDGPFRLGSRMVCVGREALISLGSEQTVIYSTGILYWRAGLSPGCPLPIQLPADVLGKQLKMA